jgi:hypothetical protein
VATALGDVESFGREMADPQFKTGFESHFSQTANPTPSTST